MRTRRGTGATRQPRGPACVAVALIASLVLGACGGDDEAQTPTTREPARQAATPTTDTTGTVERTPARSARVTREQAIAIARKRVPGARVRDVERDEEDGRQVWEVDLATRGVTHKLTIAVAGGNVIDVERDRADDRDDDRDDGN